MAIKSCFRSLKIEQPNPTSLLKMLDFHSARKTKAMLLTCFFHPKLQHLFFDHRYISPNKIVNERAIVFSEDSNYTDPPLDFGRKKT